MRDTRPQSPLHQIDLCQSITQKMHWLAKYFVKILFIASFETYKYAPTPFSACLAKRHNSSHALSNIDELLPFQNGQRHIRASAQQHPNGVLLQPINSLQKQRLLRHKPLSSGPQMVLLNLFNLQRKMLNMTTSVGNDDGHILEQFNASSTVAQPVFMPPATTVVQLADTVPEHLMMTIHEQHQHLLPFELILGTLTYLVIIGITILGNTLVILAVFSYRPLKKVQNYFIVSLAASDMLVALLVMPLHVVKFLANGQWLLGVAVCQLFTTADILLCTSSILNLCAIAIDRYWAIHDPIAYAQKRSLKLVGGMIVLVWVASAVISVPPLIGWNDWTSQQLVDHCELTSEKAFVVFSASGSFFLPLLVMVIVYVKIFLNARKRIRKNRGRSALFKMSSADQKHKRSHRIPVAATSVIALASATGAHIFRKRTLRKSSAETRGGSAVTEAGGGACRLAECAAVSSLMTTAYCSVQHQPLHVPKMPSYHGIRKEEEMDGDSGHGGSSKDSPENTVAIPPPPVPSVAARPFPSLHTPVIKRHSLTPAAAAVTAPSMVALTSSASLMAIASGEKPSPLLSAAENGGATAKKMTSPETVELKTHLKEREKISVAKEKRAAKTIAVIIFVFTFCWLPFFCAYVVMPFCPNCYLHPKVHQAFVWLGYINSSLNPFLYGILNLEFRRAFRKILCPKRVQNAQRRRLSEQLSVRKKSAPKT